MKTILLYCVIWHLATPNSPISSHASVLGVQVQADETNVLIAILDNPSTTVRVSKDRCYPDPTLAKDTKDKDTRVGPYQGAMREAWNPRLGFK